jgi:hypothetical protein
LAKINKEFRFTSSILVPGTMCNSHYYHILCDSCETICQCYAFKDISHIPSENINDIVVYTPPSDFYNQISDGLCLDISGGYGEFTDSMYSSVYLNLCHDCSVKFWDQFARSKNFNNNQGFHPSPSENKCCDYSWQP